MSIIAESQSHEEFVEEYLKDISTQMRYLNAQIKESFNTEIELSDVRTLEDYDDGT